MELWQKIVLGVLLILLVASLAFGFIKSREVKKQQETIETLQATIEELSRSEMTTAVLRLAQDVKQGTLFDPTMVTVDQLPISFSSESYVTKPELLKDSIWRLSLKKGVALTEDMLALEPIYPTDRYQLLMVDAVTPSLEIGDFVDLRLITTDGIDFVVLPKKRITNLYSTGVEVVLSETEWMIYLGSVIEKFFYRGTLVYASKYVDPSLQNKLYATYVPPREIVDFMNINANMLFPYMDGTDIESMRSYIDSVQPWNKYGPSLYSNTMEAIRDKESKIISGLASQSTSMQTARSEFIEYRKTVAEREGVEYNASSIQSSQVGVANVQGDIVSPGGDRPDSINPDGTYIDSNGVLRYPDGTPVIQPGDIVNTEDEEQEQAEFDPDNVDVEVPNINE